MGFKVLGFLIRIFEFGGWVGVGENSWGPVIPLE